MCIRDSHKALSTQLGRGARFLREHPSTAASRDLPEMQKLLSEPQVGTAVGHMCRFGARVSEPAITG
eukprot:7465042-Alexandrium_andersonii.AAC.1